MKWHVAHFFFLPLLACQKFIGASFFCIGAWTFLLAFLNWCVKIFLTERSVLCRWVRSSVRLTNYYTQIVINFSQDRIIYPSLLLDSRGQTGELRLPPQKKIQPIVIEEIFFSKSFNALDKRRSSTSPEISLILDSYNSTKTAQDAGCALLRSL